MSNILLRICPIIFLLFHLSLEENSVVSRRNRRYAAFPDGAMFSIALCMSQQTIIQNTIFSEGVNWGLGYGLPNRTTYLDNIKEKKHIIKRRDRRELYENVEVILENMGFNGRACMFRALCEAPSKLMYDKKTMPERIVETLFRYPLEPIEIQEPEEHRMYHWATRLGHDHIKNCESLEQKCPISLIDIALSLLDGQLSVG